MKTLKLLLHGTHVLIKHVTPSTMSASLDTPVCPLHKPNIDLQVFFVSHDMDVIFGSFRRAELLVLG